MAIAVETPPDQDFKVDVARSKKTTVEGLPAVWVAVCSPSREALDNPLAKQAAVDWARIRHRLTGAIDQTQGPMEDDGKTTPFVPSGDSAVNSGVIGTSAYLEMAARLNMSAAAAGKSRYIMFIRVLSNNLG